MKRADYYSIAYIAIFGGLWGVMEILLGNALHVFSVPLKGSILSAIGCIICLVGSSFLPTKNNFPIFSMGVIAIIVRLFSFGIFKIHIFVPMFTMAIFMQGAVSLIGYNIIGYMLAGVGACLAPYISGLVFFGIILGQGFAFVNHGLLEDTNFLQHLIFAGKIAILVLLSLNVMLGMLSGTLAYYFGKKLHNLIDA